MKNTHSAIIVLLILPATLGVIKADVIGFAAGLIGASTNSEFGTLDLTTGTFTGVTTYTNTLIADLALSPDGTLYALTSPDGVAGSNEIATINPVTGAITDVAVNSAGLDSFDFAAGGTLYGLSGTTPAKLYTIDPSTGATSFVTNLSGGAADDASNVTFIGNIAYTTSLLTPGSFYTINLTTGATTLAGSTGLNESNALVGEVDGQLVDIAVTNPTDEIFYVNPASAAATSGASVPEFYEVALIPTPEPGSFAMLGACAVALFALRRTRSSTTID
jgi:hypothetical protein